MNLAKRKSVNLNMFCILSHEWKRDNLAGSCFLVSSFTGQEMENILLNPWGA